MKWLITGGAGFIGSYVTGLLIGSGHDVTILDNLSTGHIDNVHPEATFHNASILDKDLVDDLCDQADVVVHLAASVGVFKILEKQIESIETNVLGTHNVVSAASKYKKRVLLASTSEVYGKSTSFPWNERSDVTLGSSLVPRWFYAIGKLADECLALAYHNERSLRVTIVRLFNTVGPRQRGQYGMVLPRFARAAVKNEPIFVYGDGSQARCFCHVADVSKAIIALCESDDAIGQVVNLGGREEVSILDLASKVRMAAESSSEIVFKTYSQAYGASFEDMPRRVPDTTLANKLIGFSPKFSLSNIIDDIVSEQKNILRGDTIRAGK